MKSFCKGCRVTKEDVLKAYDSWTSSDSGRKNCWRIDKEYGGLDKLSDELVRDIANRSLSFEPIRYSNRREAGNGKMRRIGQQSSKQQLCDYIFINAIQEFLNKRIGFYQAASIKNKGPIFASKMVQRWVQEGGYWAHLDIYHCYQSMDIIAIMRTLEKYIASSDLLYLAKTLMDTYECGLNIGSYFSLKIAQLILSFGYHEVESYCYYRRGNRIKTISHQIWYADDIYLFSHNKRELQKSIRKLRVFFKENYNLSVKPCKVCQCYKEPPDVAGYVCKLYGRTIRKSTYLRIRRAYRSYDASPSLKKARRVSSYWGRLKNANTAKAIKKNAYDRIVRGANRYISEYAKRSCAAQF